MKLGKNHNIFHGQELILVHERLSVPVGLACVPFGAKRSLHGTAQTIRCSLSDYCSLKDSNELVQLTSMM
jgi:hypothetical protein